jgi:hypothetical protein
MLTTIGFEREGESSFFFGMDHQRYQLKLINGHRELT